MPAHRPGRTLLAKEVYGVSVGVGMHRPERSARFAVQRHVGRNTRRTGISVFFASVAVNAALGIYAVVAPDFGETQGKILGTSLCVTGAVLLSLACEPAWERGLLGLVPLAAAALVTAGFALAISGIWTEPDDEVWARIMVSTLAIAIAGVVASLLALARLAPRHAWVARAAFVLLALGGALYSVLPWLGDDPDEWFARTLGVVLIAFAAFAVTVPVLHWIDRSAVAAAEFAGRAIRFCPYCGRELQGEGSGPLACLGCGSAFTVTERPSDSRRDVNLT